MVARLAALCVRPDAECYYFGYVKGAGHVLCGGAPGDCYQLGRKFKAIFGGSLDAGLCWNGRDRAGRPRDTSECEQTQGFALVTRKGGWTAVAFWDRSGDARGGSNTAFIVRGELTFEQAVRVAKHRWPAVWARFTFPVVEVDKTGRLAMTVQHEPQ